MDPSGARLPLPAIEALPLADRASAYLAVHADLLRRLEDAPALEG